MGKLRDPSEQRHPKKRSDGIRGDSGRRFLLRAYNNAVWWAQSYSPDPPLPPPPIYPHITTLKIACAAKGETPEGAFYYACITLFGGHNRTPPTLHYHQHLYTAYMYSKSFPACMIPSPNPATMSFFCSTVTAIHYAQYMAVHETVDMKHGHETVTDSISTYQFQRLDPAVVYILSLECLIAIYVLWRPA